MDLKKYIIEQYYSDSERIYNYSMHQNDKVIKSIDVLRNYISDNIEDIRITKEHCVVMLSDKRKYLLEKSNSLDMLVLKGGQSKEYEYVLRKLIRPGFHVVEAGACWGYHTVLLSKLVKKEGKISAFEPQSRAYEIAVKNLKINKCDNVQLYPFALSSENGEMTLNILEDRLFFASLGENFSDDYRRQACVVHRLDDFIQERIDAIKIDIEGAECLFLDGAQRSIKENQPIVIMEIFSLGLEAHHHSIDMIREKLRGYMPFIAKDYALQPVKSLESLICDDVIWLTAEHINKYKHIINSNGGRL